MMALSSAVHTLMAPPQAVPGSSDHDGGGIPAGAEDQPPEDRCVCQDAVTEDAWMIECDVCQVTTRDNTELMGPNLTGSQLS